MDELDSAQDLQELTVIFILLRELLVEAQRRVIPRRDHFDSIALDLCPSGNMMHDLAETRANVQERGAHTQADFYEVTPYLLD